MRVYSPSPDIQKSLSISWKEGIPAAMMSGVMDYYVVPFGLFLGASAQAVGLLAAVPNLLGSIAPLYAVQMVRCVGSRLRFVILASLLQAAALIPIALLALYVFEERIAALIIGAAAFKVLMNLITPAWGSLMSDYLPAEQRGKYFGWRSQVVGVSASISVALSGILLQRMQSAFEAIGYFLLFFGAAFLRFCSAFLLSKMTDLPLHQTSESDFTFLMFLRRFRESNFIKFIIFVSSVLFATHMAAPFFSVYMLRDLQMNYVQFMIIQITAVIAGLVAFPIWGRHADLVGNAKILKSTGLIIPFLPCLWIISANVWYLIVIQIIGGFVWAGFNLCMTNYIYDAVTPEKRVRCIGYFNLITGIAMFSGALLGGFLADRLPAIKGYSLLTLFAISGLIRFFTFFSLSRQFREVRPSAKPVSSLQLFFSVVGIQPLPAD